MTTLSLGHGAVDFASGAVPALLPFVAERYDLSYAATAGVMLAATIASSLVQPFFGLWSDRYGALWLLPGGILLAAGGIALAGFARSYEFVLLAVLVTGLGIAAYHPEGAKFAKYASGNRPASGMGLFNIGGNVGYALGPIVITPALLAFGLQGALVAVIPAFVVGVMVVRVLPRIAALAPEQRGLAVDDEPNRPRAMALLVAVIMCRSFTWFGMLTFVPLWVIADGGSKGEGNRVLSLMLVAGAVGTLALGPVADRVGMRRTLFIATFLMTPLVLIFVHVGGIIGAVAAMCAGACMVGTFSVVMILSQAYMPRNVALASGLNVGLAIGVGGIFAVLLGTLADSIDLETALTVCSFTPLAAVALILLLPAASVQRGARPLGATA